MIFLLKSENTERSAIQPVWSLQLFQSGVKLCRAVNTKDLQTATLRPGGCLTQSHFPKACPPDYSGFLQSSSNDCPLSEEQKHSEHRDVLPPHAFRTDCGLWLVVQKDSYQQPMMFNNDHTLSLILSPFLSPQCYFTVSVHTTSFACLSLPSSAADYCFDH